MDDWSRTDVRTMHFLIGAALLYEDIRHDLLKRGRRRVLIQRVGISARVYDFLMSIEDVGSVEELAGEVYKRLYLL